MVLLTPVRADEGVRALLPALAAALDGSGPAILPYAADATPPPLERSRREEMGDAAMVVATSGSTGAPKLVALPSAAIHASVAATDVAMGGPGQWLLAIPPHHIGGLLVIARSLLPGSALTVMDRSTGFTPAAFADAVERMPRGDDPAYVSLVPTQVARLLADPRGTHALARFDAVLVGGAGTRPSLRAAAADAGVHLVATYGMTETTGGCVYDGIALTDTEIHIDNDRHVVLGGPTIASGYVGDPGLTADHFHTDADGVRWFRTDDLGTLDDQGRLTISGRADDLVNTGGVKIAPGPVEDALVRFVPGVRDAVVVGVPDPTWGQLVGAAVTLTEGSPVPSLADVRARLRDALPAAALPRLVRVVDDLPWRGPGKPDRAAVRAVLAREMDSTP
ncbi:MAG: o-succinylbenzoate--CoA ligase [Dermatophilaceae bacterium]